MKRIQILTLFISAFLVSCGGRKYQEQPFGGMKGRVQMVTEIHYVPEAVRPKVEGYNSLWYTNVSVYDPIGNEISSAYMDDMNVVQQEAESQFEGRVCVKSVQKDRGALASTLVLVSRDGNVLEYESIQPGGKTEKLSLREASKRRKYTSELSRDGVPRTRTVMKLDRDGYPVDIFITDLESGTTEHESNLYDGNHNIIEKHNLDQFGNEQVLYFSYLEYDSYGNWTRAATYDGSRKPKEDIVREIKYW